MMDSPIPLKEALVVGKDEVLVIRVGGDIDEGGHLQQMQEFLNNGPLRGRYVLVVGEAEFAKVKV